MRTAHPQKPIIIGGHPILVDAKIVSLINSVNLVPGIRTTNSCQGDLSNEGYVQFVEEKRGAAIHFLQALLRHAVEDEWLGGVSVDAQTRGREKTFVFRWNPYDYRNLTRAVKTISSGNSPNRLRSALKTKS